MAAQFGTSGLRGLVTDLTPDLVAAHVRAFIASCDVGTGLFVGQDLRPSSPRLAADIAQAARSMGVTVTDAGSVPTPALALAAMSQGAGAIMVTGSHIPADRNGLKFYTPQGEITKAHEQAITAALGTSAENPVSETNPLRRNDTAGPDFVARYLQGCGTGRLAGRRIGLYSHSAVGRDLLAEILTGLGAEVTELGRSEHFIPVDTEAVDPATRTQITAWVAEHGLDALVSTDGDSDRPLLADETGRIVPGDIMGQITAEALQAEAVVTPVSSNSGILHKGVGRVLRTRIGSPYVIAGMEELGGRVAGYEANGGFLLGFEARGPAGPLPALRTRDCILPLIMTLIAAGDAPLSRRVAQEPPVVTMADRLQEIAQEKSGPLIRDLSENPAARAEFLAALDGAEGSCDLTDGVRMTLQDGRVVHVRPSGNAPELRLYVEAQQEEAARALLAAGLAHLRHIL